MQERKCREFEQNLANTFEWGVIWRIFAPNIALSRFSVLWLFEIGFYGVMGHPPTHPPFGERDGQEVIDS